MNPSLEEDVRKAREILARLPPEIRNSIVLEGFDRRTASPGAILDAAPMKHFCCRHCEREAYIRGEQFSPAFLVCGTCGNKRCPKATDHRLDCTNSNESGQPGSDY